MREGQDAFHLAVPAYDLAVTEDFYVRLLGCRLGRRYADRITLDFFGDQLVCHLSERPTDTPTTLHLYPRHFGVTFRATADFEAVLDLCRQRAVPFFAEVSTRFPDLVEAHETFVVRDPSDNLIEFKHYRDHRMMY